MFLSKYQLSHHATSGFRCARSERSFKLALLKHINSQVKSKRVANDIREKASQYISRTRMLNFRSCRKWLFSRRPCQIENTFSTCVRLAGVTRYLKDYLHLSLETFLRIWISLFKFKSIKCMYFDSSKIPVNLHNGLGLYFVSSIFSESKPMVFQYFKKKPLKSWIFTSLVHFFGQAAILECDGGCYELFSTKLKISIWTVIYWI